MNDAHEVFIKAYTDRRAETFKNASASARKAGYSALSCRKTGHRLLSKPEIREAVDKLLYVSSGKAVDDKLKRWHRSKQGLIDKTAEYLTMITGANHSARAKYLELLAKLQGFFETPLHVTTICGIKLDNSSQDIAVKFAQKISGTVSPSYIDAETVDPSENEPKTPSQGENGT